LNARPVLPKIIRCQNPQVEARILSGATIGIARTNLPEFQKKRGNIPLSPAIYAPIKALISDMCPNTYSQQTTPYWQGERRKCAIRSDESPRKQNQKQQNKPSSIPIDEQSSQSAELGWDAPYPTD